MCDCVAIVLAGGQSLLQYAVTGCVGLDATTFSVVVGYEAKSIRRLLQPPNVQIIGNSYHRIEHMIAFLASLQQAPAARSYPVCPSNMPALVVQHLDHLPAAHLASDQKKSSFRCASISMAIRLSSQMCALTTFWPIRVILVVVVSPAKTQIDSMSSTPNT